MQMLKQQVIEIIQKALHNLDSQAAGAVPEVRMENARDEKFGDYACLLAMDKNIRERFAENNAAFKNPKVFAEAICEQLNRLQSEVIEAVEVAGPGFINITIAARAQYAFVHQARRDHSTYGRSQCANPRNIIFEFVSANPTGPLNVVSARAAALGDSCCNLLEAVGERVHREFYVNDFGNQVNQLGVSCLLRALELNGCKLKFAEKQKGEAEPIYPEGPGLRFPAGGYHGDYIIDAVRAVLETDSDLLPSAETLQSLAELSAESDPGDDFLAEQELDETADLMGRAAIDYFLDTQQRDLEKFRVPFDEFYRESALHAGDDVLAARDKLGRYVYTEDNKTFFRSTDFGDDRDRVIIRDDGRPTYLLADIAYHYDKMKRGFSHIYNIWGPDHHGYIARLAGAMQALGLPEEAFRVLIAQQVTLMQDGEIVVMSKRSGRIITMAELIDEIPVDVVRYFFIMRTFESHLEFDLVEARDTSEKNPYYYVAYAHARICSIFRKATEFKLQAGNPEQWQSEAIDRIDMTPERQRLLRLVARFPEEVADAAANLEPHRLVNYLFSLATALSKFYGPRENKIIEQDPDTAGVLLDILDAVRVCLRNGLRLLGMSAPEQMTRAEDAD